MTADFINVRGDVEYIVMENGVEINRVFQKNTVVYIGKTLLLTRMLGVTQNAVSHMAIGTGIVPVSSSDTNLGTPNATRVSITAGAITQSVTMSATFGTGATYVDTFTEAGLFNASTGGQMLARVILTPIVKTSAQTVIINWTITIN